MKIEVDRQLKHIVNSLDFKKSGSDFTKNYEQYSLRISIDKRKRIDSNYPLIFLHVSCPLLTGLYANRHPRIKIEYLEMLNINITAMLDSIAFGNEQDNSQARHFDVEINTILNILNGNSTVAQLIDAFESFPSWTIASRELSAWLIKLWRNPGLDPGPFPIPEQFEVDEIELQAE